MVAVRRLRLTIAGKRLAADGRGVICGKRVPTQGYLPTASKLELRPVCIGLRASVLGLRPARIGPRASAIVSQRVKRLRPERACTRSGRKGECSALFYYICWSAPCGFIGLQLRSMHVRHFKSVGPCNPCTFGISCPQSPAIRARSAFQAYRATRSCTFGS